MQKKIDINASYNTSGSDVYLPPEEFTRIKKRPAEHVPVSIHDKPTTLMHRLALGVRAVRFGKPDEIVNMMRRILHDEFQRDPDSVRQWLDTVPNEERGR